MNKFIFTQILIGIFAFTLSACGGGDGAGGGAEKPYASVAPASLSDTEYLTAEGLRKFAFYNLQNFRPKEGVNVNEPAYCSVSGKMQHIGSRTSSHPGPDAKKTKNTREGHHFSSTVLRIDFDHCVESSHPGVKFVSGGLDLENRSEGDATITGEQTATLVGHDKKAIRGNAVIALKNESGEVENHTIEFANAYIDFKMNLSGNVNDDSILKNAEKDEKNYVYGGSVIIDGRTIDYGAFDKGAKAYQAKPANSPKPQP